MLKVKFENNETLLKVLKTVEAILNSNTTDIKAVKLAKENNKLKIIAINPSIKLQYSMGVEEISGEGALYDYKKLLALLTVIKGQILLEDGQIKSEKCTYKIPAKKTKDYPEEIIPEITEHKTTNTENFKKALENTLLSTDKISSGVLSGVYIGKNKLISCDSKRISIEGIDTDENIQNFTLSKEFIKEVLRLPFDEEIMIVPFGEKIIIQDDKIRIASNIFSEKYPSVEKILPNKIKTSTTINRQEMQDALTLVMPVIDETLKVCNLEFDNKEMKIEVKNGLENAKTSIKIEGDTKEKIIVKFNIQFLMDMLKANGEKITMNTFEDNIGYKFSSTKDSFQYIMPMVN